jgi:hypothetical protein
MPLEVKDESALFDAYQRGPAARTINDAGIEAVSRPAPQHVEEMTCPRVVDGQRPRNFVGRKENDVHRAIQACVLADLYFKLVSDLGYIGARELLSVEIFFDGVQDVHLDLFNALPLGRTTGKLGDGGPEPSLFGIGLVNEHCVFHVDLSQGLDEFIDRNLAAL